MDVVMETRAMAETLEHPAYPPDGIQQQLRTLCLQEVFAYIYRRTGNKEDAEDLTAEVYSASLLQPRKPVTQMRAWVFGIARRKLADAHRKSRVKQIPLTDAEFGAPDPHTPETMLERKECVERIRGLVDRLPEEQREALLLQHVEDMSVQDISTVMEKSAAAVNSLLQRARANIFSQGKAYFLGFSEAGNE